MRRPVVAGEFYPADAQELGQSVKTYLAKADPRVPESLRDSRLIALVVPHAGYQYSGPTAGFAYKLLQGKKKPDTIVLLGPSHNVYMKDKLSVAPFSHYRTPLGDLPVDTAARDKLLGSAAYISEARVHEPEHCLEVQLPFLQVLWDEPPKILPIIVGELRGERLAEAADALRKALGENSVILASSDFTHYGPRFGYEPFAGTRGEALMGEIKALDTGAIEHIRRMDPEGFLEYCDRTGATICGRFPIALMLEVLSKEEGTQSVSLHYASSGAMTRSYRDSVSYWAAAFYAPARAPEE